MKTVETEVLIVGGGPTGLTAALLLARQGIAHHLVERRSGPQRAPAAHAINARTFEIWRQGGADMDAILALAKDPRDAGSVYWVSRLGGEILGQLPYERQGDEVLAYTPTPLRNLSQHRLEPALIESLRAAGASLPQYQHEWLASVQDEAGVTSRLRHSDGEYEVRSRYLIAADGAGSPIRRSLGIDAIGPDRLQCFIMIHFEANLRPLVANHPGVLYWISDPACSGVLVAHDIDREWVFMVPWNPDETPRERFDDSHCSALVRAALARDVAIEIRTISAWTMTAQTAERYRDRRIFLAGDSAHRFPPTGGLGLNTGVQDVHNLVWKIAAVERGWGAPSLLDTYQEERQPIARYNAEQSLNNAARLFEVPLAMGTHDPSTARANFDRMLTDASARRAVAAAIANQAEHFDMLGLQLGFQYGGGAIVSDGSAGVEVENPVRQFRPTTRPGARLPHGWVEQGARRVSTLDLIAGDRLALLLGPEVGALPLSWDRLPLDVLRCGTDFRDPQGWWSTVAEMGADGILLVRPDQHVAFRARHGGRAALSQLEQALGRLFQLGSKGGA